MKHSGNIRELLQLQVDYIGFIFHQQSPRCVETFFDDILFPATVRKVGVFVDATIPEIGLRVRQYKLDVVQLHGKEPPEMCQQLKKTGVEVIKSFNISNQSDLDLVEKYTDVCNYFLFDAATPQYGGSGRKFDWKILSAYAGTTPFFLSGGIAPEDAERIHSFQHPALYAIDLNSRFEISPSVKDISKLKNFIRLIQNEPNK